MAFKLPNELLIYSIWYISKFVQLSLLIKNYICHECRRPNLSIRNMKFYLSGCSLVSRWSIITAFTCESTEHHHCFHLWVDGACGCPLSEPHGAARIPHILVDVTGCFQLYNSIWSGLFDTSCFLFFIFYLWISLFCTPNPSWLSLSYILFV